MSALPAAADVVARLTERGETLAVAESLTGGLLTARLTDVPGASAVLLGGVVAYATRVKVEVLGVPEQVVADHGVVSAECATWMADGVRRLTGATYALATTGVAGPAAQEGQPVGTVFVGLAGPAGPVAVPLGLQGDRAAIREQTCERALDELLSALG